MAVQDSEQILAASEWALINHELILRPRNNPMLFKKTWLEVRWLITESEWVLAP